MWIGESAIETTDGVDGLICIFNLGGADSVLEVEEDRVDRFLLTLLLGTLALDFVSGGKTNNRFIRNLRKFNAVGKRQALNEIFKK